MQGYCNVFTTSLALESKINLKAMLQLGICNVLAILQQRKLRLNPTQLQRCCNPPGNVTHTAGLLQRFRNVAATLE